MPRYAPAVSAVLMQTGTGIGVGARSYTMVHSNGRSVGCEEFVSACEPPHRIAGTVAVGMQRVDYEYLLSSIKPQIQPGYRDPAPWPETRVDWKFNMKLRSPVLWLLMPFCLFLPVLATAIFTPRQFTKLMNQLGLVAEADAGAPPQ